MNLIIFGSTSPIGQILVAQALERGHRMTAFARQPELLVVQHPNLVLARGDVLDGASLRAALAGQQAAISVLSVRRGSGLLLAEGIANLIQGLCETGVQRFVYLAAQQRRILPPSKAHLAEQAVIERCICASTLDWTIVQPGRAISPSQVVSCLLDEVETSHHLHEILKIE
jgi:uncharacterized protein YbjT (DUF2867 family)